MKKIIAVTIIATLLVSSTVASADFNKSLKMATLNNNTTTTSSSSVVSGCIFMDTKNTSKETWSQCDGKETIGTGATISIISGTGTLISEEEMKKIEKMTDSEKVKYFGKNFPLGEFVGSGTVTVSSDGKIIESVFPLNGNTENIQTIGASGFIALSEEEMKKIEKMTADEQMQYLDLKYSSKLQADLGKFESSVGVKVSSNDMVGMLGQLDEFYDVKILSLSSEKQTKAVEKVKDRLQSKIKSSSSKKKKKAYQDILSHIETNWKKR